MGLAGKRVLFFSVSYRPEHAGIGPYAAAAAERLAGEGVDVRVVAGMPHYPSWRLLASDRWRLRREDVVSGIHVSRLRQFVPFRRHTALTRGLYELSFLVHGLLSRRTWQDADVAVAVVPSLSGGLLAKAAARRRGLPLVLIVQDLSAAGALQSGIVGGRWAASMVSRLEKGLFRDADAVGLVHESLLATCLEMGVSRDRVQIVPNWSIHAPFEHVEHGGSRAWDGKFVALHAGNMGLKQGLEVVVDAARMAHDRGHGDILFVLMGDGSQRARLQRLGAGLPTLAFVDPVPDDAFPAAVAAADLALVTQRAEVSDMSLPSKLTAYWNAGRAVVASVAPDCGTAHEVHRSGGGVVVAAQDAEALLDAVLSLRRSPDRVSRLEVTGRAYAIEHLSAQSGLDRVVALVEAGLNASE